MLRKRLEKVYGTAASATLFFLASQEEGGRLAFYVAGALYFQTRFFAIQFKKEKTQIDRFVFFALSVFSIGGLLGPLVSTAMVVDPFAIVRALLGTTVVFASFSLAALIAPRRCCVYLGGVILSLASHTFFLSLLNVFVLQSPLVYEIQLYLELFLICMIVAWDTRKILRERDDDDDDDDDYLAHSFVIFIDFFRIFWRILRLSICKNKK